MEYEELVSRIRELAESCALVSPKDLLAVLDGDEAPLQNARWLNELCNQCGHRRNRHNGYGGYGRRPHCEIIGTRSLTQKQQRAGKDDTVYCPCGIHYERVVAKMAVTA